MTSSLCHHGPWHLLGTLNTHNVVCAPNLHLDYDAKGGGLGLTGLNNQHNLEELCGLLMNHCKCTLSFITTRH